MSSGIGSSVSENETPASFYERIDAETFMATDATMSPWDERLQHGGPPTALMARVMSDTFPRNDVRIARITSEFLGPIPIGTMRVRTRVVRPGRRIELLEGVIENDGREVVSTRVWRIATQPEGSVPPGVTPRDPVPALPDPGPAPDWFKRFGYGQAIEWRYLRGAGVPGPAAVWSRPRVPLIAGAPLQPIDAALLVADSANGISGELAMSDWLFVPPSLSLAIERYPHTEWVLLEARTSLSSDGLGVTTLRLGDADGFFAAGTQALLVEARA